MNEQTKKLVETLMSIWDEDCPISVTRNITNQILRACKEAGLVFKVDREVASMSYWIDSVADRVKQDMLKAGYVATLEIEL